MKEYTTYLFDVDGTLIDTAELIFQCFKYSCKKYADHEVTRDQVMINIGLPFRKQLETYIGPVSDDRHLEIFAGHMKFQKENYKEYLRVFPNVIEVLQTLKNNNKNIGIVTSRKRDTLDLYLTEMELYDYFKHIISPEDTQEHKPSPEPIFEALRRINSNPEATIYIGDSVYDIECGFRAGCDTAFVEWSSIDAKQCHITPTYVISDAMEILS